MSNTNWDADEMLDLYIRDYLIKRKFHATAKAFQAEANVPSNPVALEAPRGFLFECWSVFWDICLTVTDEKHSEVAASYIETQKIKARELQQQQQQVQSQREQMIQMQQLLRRRQEQEQQQQQQRRDDTPMLYGSDAHSGSDLFIRQNPTTTNASTSKTYEESSELPIAIETLDDAFLEQMLGDSVGDELLDPNNASLLNSAPLGGQISGEPLHGTSGGFP